MTQSIALDTKPVPENAVSSQQADAKKQGVACEPLNVVSVLFVLLVIGLVAALVAALTTRRQSGQSFCPDKWIGLQDDCYYFSDHERNWTSSRNYCSTKHADLAVINSTNEMDFLRQHKCTSDHWIGLEMKGYRTGKWVNGEIFNQSQSFEVRGNETCVYLSDDGVATARCYTERKFICKKEKSTG